MYDKVIVSIFVMIILFSLTESLTIPIIDKSLIQSGLITLQMSYIRSLNKAPLITNMLTASTLAVCSDCISQNIELSNKNNSIKLTNNLDNQKEQIRFSFYRSFCMSLYGAFILGWFVTIWFKFLNHLIPREGITLNKVILKVFINQILMSPFLNSLFFGYVILTRDFNNNLQQKFILYKKKLSVDLLPTIARSCVYWSIVHLYNFLKLPDKYQLLYTNAAFLLWTIYISLIGYRVVK